MSADMPNSDEKRHWESVHVCPKCEHVVNLAEIDLKAITTGILSCPNCDWSGPIEIRVIDGPAPPQPNEQK
jgi:transcription elongation factor Elf1